MLANATDIKGKQNEHKLVAFTVVNRLSSLASSTKGMVASAYICTSTVYKPTTVFLDYQCLQIHSHLPMNGRRRSALFIHW